MKRVPVLLEACYDSINNKAWWLARTRGLEGRGDTAEQALMILCINLANILPSDDHKSEDG